MGLTDILSEQNERLSKELLDKQTEINDLQVQLSRMKTVNQEVSDHLANAPDDVIGLTRQTSRMKRALQVYGSASMWNEMTNTYPVPGCGLGPKMKRLIYSQVEL